MYTQSRFHLRSWLPALFLFLVSCDSGVVANYKSVRTQKLLLESKDGKVYELTIEKDSVGNDKLGIHEVAP